MNSFARTGTAAALAATLMLATGCGGSSAKPDAAEASASAAIAALSSKLAALTSPAATPAAATSATPATPAAAAATSAAGANPAPTSAVPAAPTSGGLPVVPSGAALSSLLATTSSAPAPAASNLAALKSQVDSALGGAAGATDVSKYCNAIPHADLQALVKATVGAAIAFPFQCAWNGTGLKVSVNPNDDDIKGSSELIGSDGKAISGVGDLAKWDSPVPNMTLPNVYAQKGAKFTCFVAGDDVPTSTIAYTGSDPFFKITDAAELAYANKEAKLCSDVFAVG